MNLCHWLVQGGEPEARAVWDRDRWITYGDLTRRIRRVAALVQDRARPASDGAPPIVPIIGDNAFDQIAAYLGVLFAGAVAAPLGPMTDHALAAVLAETAATLVLAAPADVDRVTRLGGRDVLPWDIALAEEAHAPAEVDGDALALLLYTSGSTGTPQGVMVSSENVRCNVRAILGCQDLTPADRTLVSLPFYYCFGLSVLHTHLRRGAAVMLEPTGCPEDTVALLDALGATGYPGVPSMFHGLTARSSLATRELPSLRYLLIAGGKPTERVVRELRDAVPRARVYLRYGATEATSAASYLPPEQLDAKLGSIGRGLPEAPLAVEREDGTPVAAGSDEIGEIVIRGGHVALGYFRCADQGARGFSTGAFRTGDLARVDRDGDVFVVGRAREFVKTAGHRVSPQEIEEVISQLAPVGEVGVFGAPHTDRGEALVAVVVARPGQSITVHELRRHCRGQLPPFKVPVAFHVATELPKTPNQKLDRRALASRFVAT